MAPASKQAPMTEKEGLRMTPKRTWANEATIAGTARFCAAHKTKAGRLAGAKARRLKVLRMENAGCSRHDIAVEMGVSSERVRQLLLIGKNRGESAYD